MGFKENGETLLSRLYWSRCEPAATAGISSGIVSQARFNPAPAQVLVRQLQRSYGATVTLACISVSQSIAEAA